MTQIRKTQYKRDTTMMDEYFSTLFYDDPADVFGIDSALNNNEKPKSENSTDHTQFYNNYNLEGDCSERLLERNAAIDKLIAKFDNHIENIWKTTAKPDSLQNIKRQAIFSQNPGLQYGSNLFWPFEQNKIGEGNSTITVESKNGLSNKSSFSDWNKYSSPVLNSSNGGFDSLLSTFNFTFSNVQKWSAVDNCNNLSNLLSNYNKYENNSTEIPRKTISLAQSDDMNFVFEIGQNFQEEEDLLISAKTHFRPIKTDELVGSQTKLYADGTTFAISNELEKVAFKRSESGTLYLDTDAATPRKYMEFKEKEVFESKGDWESDFSSVEEFIPKFRVRQSNEKSVQTDEIDEERKVLSAYETDCESVSSDSQEDEFYFPGDDELAQNIINTIEAESTLDNEILNSDHGSCCKRNTLEMSSYIMPKYVQCICSDGNNWNRSLNKDACNKQEWSKIWNSKITCDSCQINGDRLSSKDKFKFREELTLEGEQLLLDLSCLQQMYSSSDWCNCESVSVSDSNEEKERMHSPNEEIRIEKFTKFDLEYPKKNDWWTQLIAKEEPIKKGFDLRCLWKEKFLLQIPKENEKNERPFVANLAQNERKRRNSSSQKTCTVYLEGKPHCNFTHYDSPFPWPFFAEPSCKKGESCILSHTMRRPLSM